mmetsp:Transcript_14916/g.40842  ORF Transcript_14916/g.40842 Transcript_14916/m.40842 type:complete len:306 (-) Transcript_14916:740-1657(-)
MRLSEARTSSARGAKWPELAEKARLLGAAFPCCLRPCGHWRCHRIPSTRAKPAAIYTRASSRRTSPRTSQQGPGSSGRRTLPLRVPAAAPAAGCRPPKSPTPLQARAPRGPPPRSPNCARRWGSFCWASPTLAWTLPELSRRHPWPPTRSPKQSCGIPRSPRMTPLARSRRRPRGSRRPPTWRRRRCLWRWNRQSRQRPRRGCRRRRAATCPRSPEAAPPPAPPPFQGAASGAALAAEGLAWSGCGASSRPTRLRRARSNNPVMLRRASSLPCCCAAAPRRAPWQLQRRWQAEAPKADAAATSPS